LAGSDSRSALKHANQSWSKAIELVGHDQYADHDLLRALRIRLNLNPQIRHVEHYVHAPRVAGDLDGPLDHSRIASAHGQVGVGLAGELVAATLQRNFGEQHLIHHLSAEFLVVLLVGAWCGDGSGVLRLLSLGAACCGLPLPAASAGMPKASATLRRGECS
jgi:hypothetical protein